jgi:cytochrome P450
MVLHLFSSINYIHGSIGVLLGYGVSILARRYYLWYASPLRLVPGPPPLSFFLGYLLVILREPFMDPHKRWWNDYRKKHDGKSPPLFAYSNIFGSYSVLLLDPDLVKTVLMEPAHRDPVRFVKNYFFLTETLGSGLATLEGSAWSRHRRLIQPSFHNVSFLKEALNEAVSDRVQRLISAWLKVAGTSRTIDVVSHMSAITLDVLGDVAFSHDFGATRMIETWAAEQNASDDADAVKESMDPLIKALQTSLKLTFTTLMLSALNMSRFEKYISKTTARTRTLLNQAVDNVIQKARNKSGKSDSSENSIRNKSLLQLLFEASDEQSSDGSGIGRTKLSNIELRDETKTFIVAGHETTSTWCYWAMYALAKYPEVQQKLYSDIRQHSSSSSVQTPLSVDEVDSMEYLSAFLNEVLRLYSPVGLIFRFTTQEESWRGYVIPRKTRVILPIHLLHRHPDYWSNPDDFIPERWLNKEECNARHKFCFIPFSAGGRNCVGQRFAEMEARLIVANICQNFQIHLAPCMQDKEITFTNFISMKSKPLVAIQVQKR